MRMVWEFAWPSRYAEIEKLSWTARYLIEPFDEGMLET